MQIASLEIENIRAIRRVALENIAQVVLIAGPNGCGKSCIFDAIRLLKSCYGGYQPNEWQQWFGEYGININRRPDALKHLFRNKQRNIRIAADFRFTSSEISFLNTRLEDFADRIAWEIVAPHAQGHSVRPVARDIRAHESEVKRRSNEIVSSVRESLRAPLHRAELTVSSNGIQTLQNPLLELVFSAYEPEHLGIIDFHGANRTYNREDIGAINLNIESSSERDRQSHLYNYSAKYTNIKSEMATTYVRGLLSQKLGLQLDKEDSITETLKEMFRTFFPDKVFLGPVPTSDRALSFPVRIGAGIEHDINDLSSGEKEVLFGYLRLRNSSPRNSVIMLDEPEMHLNPGLIRGLPQFYKKHIGEAMDNQLWLVTHSDAFLREAVGQAGFDVFHMRHADQARETENPNQLIRVSADGEIERAIIDLVGDLATFQPGSPVVIFEGENSDFDVEMTCRLFPELRKNVNPVSAGSKTNAIKLHRLLRDAGQRAAVSDRFFTIVDQDDSAHESTDGVYVWPVYHIENFLLSPEHIYSAVSDIIEVSRKILSIQDVDRGLRAAAAETMTDLVRHRLQNFANEKTRRALHIEAERGASVVADSLIVSLARSRERINTLVDSELSADALAAMESRERERLTVALDDGTWRAVFRGRDVLKRFVSSSCGGTLRYEVLRDLIVGRMRDSGHRPPGMSLVVDAIMKSVERTHGRPLR